MVVACLFAGVGAWATKVEVDNVTTYASELFGDGHPSPMYPDGMTPIVVVTIPGNAATDDADTKGVDETMLGNMHNGEADITFTLTGGAKFDANVTGLMWDSDLGTDGPDIDGDEDGNPDTADADDGDIATGNLANDFVAAPGTVASIESGGRKGDEHITIKIKAAGGDGGSTPADTRRLGVTGTTFAGQNIVFYLPRLASLGHLAGATDKAKHIMLEAEARIVGGAFSDGALGTTGPGGDAPAAMSSRNAVTVSISDSNMKSISIDGDTAFKAIKGSKDYTQLATVTIMTRQVSRPGSGPVRRMNHYFIKANEDTDDNVGDDDEDTSSDTDDVIYTPARGAVSTLYHRLYGLDGGEVDQGLRGTLTINAEGTRSLFNEDDMLFVDYDGNGMMGNGEGIAIDGMMAMGDGLSIDPDRSDSFNAAGTGTFNVYYMPGGKSDIHHGATIKVTGMVEYSDPSAIDEAPVSATTTLNFDGVGNPVRAYAIPHSTNSIGDKGNVRVRCEASAGCRVFLECWDKMGMRGFGVAPMIEGNSVMVWSGEDIEGVTGMEPTSRHSCRVLSTGMVTVQQLTRDGNSGTLVNNTFVGGG